MKKILISMLAFLAIATTARAQSNGTWSVRLDDVGPNKTNVIKVVSDELGLGLKAAKDLVDSAPCTLVENVTEAQAEDLAQKLRDAGATVTVQNNNGTAPSSGKWSVRLDDAGSSEVNVVKVVKEELGVTLAEARDLVNSAPCTLVENVTEAQAEDLAQKLRDAGATVTVGISINATNFPDANFRNWLLAQAYGTDGILTPEEIAAVTSISVSGKSIADLTGIEYFTALTSLVCYSNLLTSLDVSGCTALTLLSCYRNQLTSLNVTGCTALEYLYCSGNQLTSLNASGCTALTILDCSSNQLTSLDVSGCTALTSLSCYSNQLKGDDMLALVNSLPKVSIGRFYVIDTKDPNEQNVITKSQVAIATGKNWRVVDSDGEGNYAGSDDPTPDGIAIDETNFPDANFRSFVAATRIDTDGNGFLSDEEIAAVTSISVSGKSIADLTGIEYFTALTSLLCYSNQLTSLDVSGCTALTSLSCYSNQLTSLDVSGCTALTSLSCYRNQLTSLDVSGCTALTSLQCSSNQLTSLNVSGCTALTWLYCQSNQLTSLDVSGCTALSSLQCSSNQIKGDKMQALVESLPTVTNGSFYVINTTDTSEGNVITKSQVAIAKGKKWKVYDYNGGTAVEYEGSDDPTPDGIAIDETNFPDANFRNWLLAQAYGTDGILTPEEIAAVTSISVSGKSIADLTGIEHFTALTNLRCTGNQLTSLDVSGNTELTYLECSENQLTELNVSQNKKLTELWCDGNQIKGDKMLALVESLPEVTPSKRFGVINTKNDNEGNVITKSQVKIATDKGWAVKDRNGGSVIDYAGSDIPGDVNGDGVVNASDIMSIYNIMKQ